ncbi:PREDICTED: retinoid-inducible serine carboxypeptidase-like [Branchiostoma belcheri]|uniref:Retinoid-inducible serine carboxypeptidase n=1 Tax=Branchiostoma belcheri TaxID=7741 RepID=A0A6P4XSF7_BRABE|nr:PREDICTED: retinoid-inducible serine carboxypeptidase-like [Branchiostoma belcheri]
MAARTWVDALLWPALVIGACLVVSGCAAADTDCKPGPKVKNQDWGYVDVRSAAHMFWWLYYNTDNLPAASSTPTPLILWLQGGPGGSSTGFGNFQEIGPMDVSQQPRNTTWLSVANLLFIDNPVGTGYSYVTNKNAYATDVSMVAADLVTLLKAFFNCKTDLQNVPFYIFCESYGGKMSAALAQALYKAVKQGEVKCDLKGVALGDSWISAMDYVNTWGPYLKATSLLDHVGLQAVQKSAQQTQAAVDQGRWRNATELWSRTEDVLEEFSNGVSFYNILGDKVKFEVSGSRTPNLGNSYIEMLYRRHVSPLHAPSLAELMNGPIKKYLEVIPEDVTWGAQSGEVFAMMAGDFMKPVIDIVDDLIQNTDLAVVVYNGQLDLICNTIGTEAWVHKLKWPGLAQFDTKRWKPIMTKEKTVGFVKTVDNFSFYWILNAGHMVPADAGETALRMVTMVMDSQR